MSLVIVDIIVVHNRPYNNNNSVYLISVSGMRGHDYHDNNDDTTDGSYFNSTTGIKDQYPEK